MFDYKVLVTKLDEALSLVAGELSAAQVEDVRLYIKVGEWRLALETLCELLYEDELPIPVQAYELMKEAGAMMNLDAKLWSRLQPQILATVG